MHLGLNNFITKVSAATTEEALGRKFLNYGTTSNLNSVLQSTIDFIFNLAVILSIVFIAAGALKLITSAGNKTAVDSAKSTLKYAFTALISLFLLNLLLPILLKVFLG